MKATKRTLTVTIEALSVDCFPSLLIDLTEELSKERLSGRLVHDDGDTIIWNTKQQEVQF